MAFDSLIKPVWMFSKKVGLGTMNRHPLPVFHACNYVLYTSVLFMTVCAQSKAKWTLSRNRK
jgi:hypothetical protein